jgi:hypothetical protein
MGRIQLAVAVLVSAIVTVVGVFLGVTSAGTDTATFGWVLAALGALFLVANLVLRTRLR